MVASPLQTGERLQEAGDLWTKRYGVKRNGDKAFPCQAPRLFNSVLLYQYMNYSFSIFQLTYTHIVALTILINKAIANH